MIEALADNPTEICLVLGTKSGDNILVQCVWEVFKRTFFTARGMICPRRSGAPSQELGWRGAVLVGAGHAPRLSPTGRPEARAPGHPGAATLRSPAPQVQAAATPRDAWRRAAAAGGGGRPGGRGERVFVLSIPSRWDSALTLR